MPVPREAMRLVGEPRSPKLVTIRSRKDMTKQMVAWANARVEDGRLHDPRLRENFIESCLKEQTYLNPHPTALKLRNHD